jgi:hypothetical protein
VREQRTDGRQRCQVIGKVSSKHERAMADRALDLAEAVAGDRPSAVLTIG